MPEALFVANVPPLASTGGSSPRHPSAIDWATIRIPTTDASPQPAKTGSNHAARRPTTERTPSRTAGDFGARGPPACKRSEARPSRSPSAGSRAAGRPAWRASTSRSDVLSRASRHSRSPDRDARGRAPRPEGAVARRGSESPARALRRRAHRQRVQRPPMAQYLYFAGTFSHEPLGVQGMVWPCHEPLRDQYAFVPSSVDAGSPGLG